MARKPGTDERQEDLFGAAKPAQGAPRRRSGKSPKSESTVGTTPGCKPRTPSGDDVLDRDSIDVQVARLSPAELRDLVATLPDEALAQLTLAAIRQLRHRLGRDGQRGARSRTSVLDRAAQQLITELAEPSDDDDI